MQGQGGSHGIYQRQSHLRKNLGATAASGNVVVVLVTITSRLRAESCQDCSVKAGVGAAVVHLKTHEHRCQENANTRLSRADYLQRHGMIYVSKSSPITIPPKPHVDMDVPFGGPPYAPLGGCGVPEPCLLEKLFCAARRACDWAATCACCLSIIIC